MRHVIISGFLSAVLFTACDKIPPRVPPPVPDCVFDNSVTVVNTNTATSNTRKVLLENYTGHACGQCPPAMMKAKEIAQQYSNQIIILANHVTRNFAEPKVNNWQKDLRDPASTEWDDRFTISKGVGLPSGTVNRVSNGGKYPLKFATWEGHVITEINKPQTVQLDVTTTYDPSQKLLHAKVFTRFKAALNFNVNLVMVLSQDSLIGDQSDYAPPSGVTVVDSYRRPDYKFDYIMVKSLNGSWGERIKTAPVAVNDTVTVSKRCNIATKCFYKNDLCTNDRQLYLVVFACNDETKEVLQVEKVKLR